MTPDYFTEGVKMLVSFDKFDKEKGEVSINVTVPQIKVGDYISSLPEITIEEDAETFIVKFTVNGKSKQIELTFKEKQRRSVGRTGQIDLSIDDSSISKMHAALVLNAEKKLMVADTGSTNGTFINDKRIAYGRAFPIAPGDRVKFGNIEVSFEYIPREVENVEPEEIIEYNVPTENFSASQGDIKTVAFNSSDDVSLNTEIISPIKRAEIISPKENVPQMGKVLPKENVAETRFVEIKPEKEVKPENPNNSTSTQDRINYEFNNEE